MMKRLPRSDEPSPLKPLWVRMMSDSAPIAPSVTPPIFCFESGSLR